jgi:bifunctional non-homologous end joining protein LigD
VTSRVKARFIEPMLLEPSPSLPEGEGWTYELKLDGYRALGIRGCGPASLRSRNGNDFTLKYPAVARALQALPDETVVDGEVVALDETGRPSFNLLQNRKPGAPVVYYLFDVLVLEARDVMALPLSQRRALLEGRVLPRLDEPVRSAPQFDVPLAGLIRAVREQGLEGLVAKRLDSRYEPGRRSGAWKKMRLNRGQEFVIGGYTPGSRAGSLDAIILGYYDAAGRLLFAARTRNGFTPATREQVARRFRGLETAACPFANLPEPRGGRWGQGLTADKMAECRWLRPELVAQVEFVEWTPDDHLRHAKFVALREDKDPSEVRREPG